MRKLAPWHLLCSLRLCRRSNRLSVAHTLSSEIYTVLGVSTTRSISSDYGLYQALLGPLPLSKGFNCVPYGRIERPLFKNREIRSPEWAAMILWKIFIVSYCLRTAD